MYNIIELLIVYIYIVIWSLQSKSLYSLLFVLFTTLDHINKKVKSYKLLLLKLKCLLLINVDIDNKETKKS